MSKPNLLAIWAKHERGEGATNGELGHLIERFESLQDRLEQAEQAVQRVREKHGERVLVYPGGAEEHYCAYDQDSAWPCGTIRALDGEQS